MQLNELKDEAKKEPIIPECMALVLRGINPFGWRPGFRPFNVHHVTDHEIAPFSPISSEYQERILKEVMDDAKGG